PARAIAQSRKRAGSHEVDAVLTPKVNFEEGTIEPDHHREIRTRSTQLQLDLGYGLTDRLTLVARVPLLNDKYHEHVDDVGTDEEHFSNRDGGSGFGDVEVGVRGALAVRARALPTRAPRPA